MNIYTHNRPRFGQYVRLLSRYKRAKKRLARAMPKTPDWQFARRQHTFKKRDKELRKLLACIDKTARPTRLETEFWSGVQNRQPHLIKKQTLCQ